MANSIPLGLAGRVSVAVLMFSTAFSLAAPDSPGRAAPKRDAAEEVTDFSLLDQDGRFYQLRRQTEAKAVVLLVGGNGCPIVRQNVQKFQVLQEKFASRKVRFWMLNANSQDDPASIRSEANEFNITVPILKDESQLVARRLGVKRTAEVFAIDTKDWTIFYRGALDDQMVEGGIAPAPSDPYLENALTAFLSGHEIPLARTRAAGCLIHYEEPVEKAKAISYARDVAPILADRCVSCHSEGNIGPFNMSSYKVVKGYSDTIREVLLNKQMPPWHADPHFGKFQGDRSISIAQLRTLIGWIDAGCPRGDGDDPLVVLAKMPPTAEGWTLGPPDYIVAPSQAMTVPATGVVEYITNVVQSPLTEDAWLRAAVIRPDNKKVLHHAIVYLEFPETYQRRGEARNNNWLTGWAPGYRMTAFPEGTGKFLPKGTKLRWQLHYTTMGSEQKDRTELGLYLLKEKPPLEVDVQAVWNADFKIAPGSRDSRILAMRDFPRDTLVYELNPHMHKRGSWFRFEALYPDGRFETLLSVPKYDFNWQTGYRLSEPKRLPAGTRILCTGGFDNSRQNPSNPDPKKQVRWGDQSWEEMFIGFMTVSDVPRANGHALRRPDTETASVPGQP